MGQLGVETGVLILYPLLMTVLEEPGELEALPLIPGAIGAKSKPHTLRDVIVDLASI